MTLVSVLKMELADGNDEHISVLSSGVLIRKID